MAEAFQIVSAAFGCVEVCFRVCSAIGKFVSRVSDADTTAAELHVKTSRLHGIITGVAMSLKSRNDTRRPLDDEERRIWNNILCTIISCQGTLEAFEGDIAAIQGPARQGDQGWDVTRRTMLAVKLDLSDPKIKRFERSVNEHLMAVQIYFCLLQTHSYNVMVDLLAKHVLSGTTYLTNRSYEHCSQGRYRWAYDSQNTIRAEQAAESSLENNQPETEEQISPLKNLRESINVAQDVVERISRPPTPQPTASSSVQVQQVVRTDPATDPTRHINAPNCKGITPLVKAIKKGEIAETHYFLAHGADVKQICENKTPLMHAVEQEDPSVVHILQKYRPDLEVEARDSEGRTAMVIASQLGKHWMVEAMKSIGADIEAVTKGGVTPLMHAAESGHASVVSLLLRRNANILAKDQDGWSALHHAVHGVGGQPVIELLVDSGVNVNVRCDSTGETPLHFAIKQYEYYGTRKAALESLLMKRADVNTRDSGDNTPLSIAVEECKEELVELLINNGATYDREIPTDLPRSLTRMLREHQPTIRRGSALRLRGRRRTSRAT